MAPVCLASDGWANTRCETAILSMLDSVITRFSVDTSKILVTGYSMGGTGTWYFAVKHPEIFKAAIPVSGYPPTNVLPLNSIIPTYIIHSTDDEIVPINNLRAVVINLKDAGCTVEFKILEFLLYSAEVVFIKNFTH